MAIAGETRVRSTRDTQRMGRVKQREAWIQEGKALRLLQVGKVRTSVNDVLLKYHSTETLQVGHDTLLLCDRCSPAQFL